MSNNAKLNYAIDVAIGLTFVLAALSGLVLFLAPSGYQGGRNPYHGARVLFLYTHTWDTLHTWSSIAMISGVGAHLVMHWKWILYMTKRLLTAKKPLKQDAATV